jgi:hypothetical protein
MGGELSHMPNATGSNPGPERRAPGGADDAPQGTTSKLEPELRGKPRKGSRMDAER